MTRDLHILTFVTLNIKGCLQIPGSWGVAGPDSGGEPRDARFQLAGEGFSGGWWAARRASATATPSSTNAATTEAVSGGA
ncbi:hypothetical protein PSN01_01046 [Micromonospora saelicesensis]|nr:hypothetical protein PSN01_01046 [Micromonospora saelicesensis]